MIGPHLQRPFNNWPPILAPLPNRTPFKSVDDLHLLRDAKQVNPQWLTVFRKGYTQSQQPGSSTAVNRQKARDFLATFIDGTFWEQRLWRYIDSIEEWNEYLANSQTEQEKLIWLNWCEAVCWVWANEYQAQYPNEIGHGRPGGAIRLALCNTAIGNDIDHRFAQIAANYGNYLAYHNYTFVQDGVIGGFVDGRHALTAINRHGQTLADVWPGYGRRRSAAESSDEEWRWLSGRWAFMDADYRSRGITVQWLFTEGGAFRDVVGGWRHPQVYNGNLSAYVDGAITNQLQRTAVWNQSHANRALGGVIFTSGNVGWEMYQVNQNEWPAIAQRVAQYPPGVPPPPTGNDWQRELWDESVRYQIEHGIQLNPHSGLQEMITSRPGRFTPVHNETRYTTIDGVRRGYIAGEDLITGQRLLWTFIPPWTGPNGVTVYGKPND